ncbi:MAG: hypothetical protein WBC86_00535 [Pseudolabrys sp.]
MQIFILFGDAVGVALFILGAGGGRRLLDQLPNIVACNGNPTFEFGKRK